jgi:hypothetical protein
VGQTAIRGVPGLPIILAFEYTGKKLKAQIKKHTDAIDAKAKVASAHEEAVRKQRKAAANATARRMGVAATFPGRPNPFGVAFGADGTGYYPLPPSVREYLGQHPQFQADPPIGYSATTLVVESDRLKAWLDELDRRDEARASTASKNKN